MLVREKNLKDEYREIVEKEEAKKEAEEKKLADLAAKKADLGHPTVAAWHNVGGTGHVAVVIPGEGGIVSIAQAGADGKHHAAVGTHLQRTDLAGQPALARQMGQHQGFGIVQGLVVPFFDLREEFVDGLIGQAENHWHQLPSAKSFRAAARSVV